jgi:hypothetical protein
LTVIVLVPVVPCVRVKLLGVAERVKFGVDDGQLFTKLAALMLPIPVAKSQPAEVPYATLSALSEVESTPVDPEGK